MLNLSSIISYSPDELILTLLAPDILEKGEGSLNSSRTERKAGIDGRIEDVLLSPLVAASVETLPV